MEIHRCAEEVSRGAVASGQLQELDAEGRVLERERQLDQSTVGAEAQCGADTLGAPQGFVAAWDAWLQAAMLHAQSALGADWDAHYMSAPIWRFSLSPGLAGASRAMGVLMPSVDRVGRRFPLTLMAPLPATGRAAASHFAQKAIFSWLEDLALDSLEDDMTREALDARLDDVAPPENGAGAEPDGALPVLARCSRSRARAAAVCSSTSTRTAPRPGTWPTPRASSRRPVTTDGTSSR